jgi:hypothetical protein
VSVGIRPTFHTPSGLIFLLLNDHRISRWRERCTDHRKRHRVESDDLMDLKVGKARRRTLCKGKPTNADLLEIEIPDLPTGYIGANIRKHRSKFRASA